MQKETQPLEPFIDAFDARADPERIRRQRTVGNLLLKGDWVSQDQQDRFDLMVKVIKAVNTIDLSGSTGGAVVRFRRHHAHRQRAVPFGSPGASTSIPVSLGPVRSAVRSTRLSIIRCCKK